MALVKVITSWPGVVVMLKRAVVAADFCRPVPPAGVMPLPSEKERAS